MALSHLNMFFLLYLNVLRYATTSRNTNEEEYSLRLNESRHYEGQQSMVRVRGRDGKELRNTTESAILRAPNDLVT